MNIPKFQFFKKYPILLLVLLSLSPLLNANQAGISQTTEILWNYLKVPLDSLQSKSVYFDVVKSADSGQISFRLTDYAMRSGFTVFESKNDSVTVVNILADNKILVKRQNYLLFTKEDTMVYPQYLVLISKGDRVLFSSSISINETISKKTKTITRWYEPVMLSAVIGSLVYLIYYGNH